MFFSVEKEFGPGGAFSPLDTVAAAYAPGGYPGKCGAREFVKGSGDEGVSQGSFFQGHDENGPYGPLLTENEKLPAR